MDYVERQENGEYITNSLINGSLCVVKHRGIASAEDPTPDWVVVLPFHYDVEQKKQYNGDRMAKSLVIKALTNSIYRKGR